MYRRRKSERRYVPRPLGGKGCAQPPLQCVDRERRGRALAVRLRQAPQCRLLASAQVEHARHAAPGDLVEAKRCGRTLTTYQLSRAELGLRQNSMRYSLRCEQIELIGRGGCWQASRVLYRQGSLGSTCSPWQEKCVPYVAYIQQYHAGIGAQGRQISKPSMRPQSCSGSSLTRRAHLGRRRARHSPPSTAAHCRARQCHTRLCTGRGSPAWIERRPEVAIGAPDASEPQNRR